MAEKEVKAPDRDTAQRVDVESLQKENADLKAQNQKLGSMVNKIYAMYSDLMTKYLEN